MPFHNDGHLTHITCKSSCSNEIKKKGEVICEAKEKINKPQKDSKSWKNYLNQYKKNSHFKRVPSVEKVNP